MVNSTREARIVSEYESEGVISTELNKSGYAWNGQRYGKYPDGVPCLTVMKMCIEANTTLPWHQHPMPNVAYIVSGQLTIEDKATGESRVFKAGEVINESVNDTHRGYTTEEAVEVIVTYVGIEGQALSIPYQS